MARAVPGIEVSTATDCQGQLLTLAAIHTARGEHPGTVNRVILRYLGPSAGAALSVCDNLCAIGALNVLGRNAFGELEEGATPSHQACVHCAWCGTLLVANQTCVWHADGCPDRYLLMTIPAALICEKYGMTLTDTRLARVQREMAVSLERYGHVDPEMVVNRLIGGHAA